MLAMIPKIADAMGDLTMEPYYYDGTYLIRQRVNSTAVTSLARV